MFAYIEGTLTTRNPAYVVVDCQGVGYMIHISLNTFTQIKDMTSARLLSRASLWAFLRPRFFTLSP